MNTKKNPTVTNEAGVYYTLNCESDGKTKDTTIAYDMLTLMLMHGEGEELLSSTEIDILFKPHTNEVFLQDTSNSIDREYDDDSAIDPFALIEFNEMNSEYSFNALHNNNEKVYIFYIHKLDMVCVRYFHTCEIVHEFCVKYMNETDRLNDAVTYAERHSLDLIASRGNWHVFV